MRLENNKWKMVKLGDCCQFFNGKAHEKQIDNNGNYIVVNSRFISSSGAIYKKTKEALFPLFKNDIVMVMSDVPKGKALAKCYLIEEDNKYSLNQRICAIRSDKVEARFLYYHLNRHPYLLNFDNGENQTNLRKEDILKCPLYIPPIEEQKRIVEILDKAFEGIAQAEANTRRNLINARELFDSYLNQVFTKHDQNWTQEPLGKVCTLQRGYDLPQRLRVEGKFPLVSSSGIIDSHQEAKVKAPGVVTGRSGSIGSLFYVKENFWPLNTVLYVKDFHENDPEFIFYLLKHFNLGKYASGAGVPTLNRNHVHSVLVKKPIFIEEQKNLVKSLNKLQEYQKRLETIYQRKLEAIAELKQSILEKAFTGQLSQ